MYKLIALLPLLLPSWALAVDIDPAAYRPPAVALAGPAAVRPGHMVIVRAHLDRASLSPNLIALKYQWAVLVDGKPADDLLVWPDGTQVVFQASDSPSTTTVILDVDCTFGVPVPIKDGTAFTNVETVSPDLLRHAIAVGQEGPPPAPPTPPPTPAPPLGPLFPAGQFGLSQFFYDTVQAQAGLTGHERYLVAQALAGSYTKAAGFIAPHHTLDSVLTAIGLGNRSALAPLGIADTKLAALKQAIGDKVYELVQVKQTLRTASDAATAWREAARGLLAIPDQK